MRRVWRQHDRRGSDEMRIAFSQCKKITKLVGPDHNLDRPCSYENYAIRMPVERQQCQLLYALFEGNSFWNGFGWQDRPHEDRYAIEVVHLHSLLSYGNVQLFSIQPGRKGTLSVFFEATCSDLEWVAGMNGATIQLLGWAGSRAAEAIADRVAERAARVFKDRLRQHVSEKRQCLARTRA